LTFTGITPADERSELSSNRKADTIDNNSDNFPSGKSFKPTTAQDLPKFAGIKTYMRLPHCRTTQGIDFAVVGKLILQLDDRWAPLVFASVLAG